MFQISEASGNAIFQEKGIKQFETDYLKKKIQFNINVVLVFLSYLA